LWTFVNTHGTASPSFLPEWIPVDANGHRLKIYRSEGWGTTQTLPARALAAGIEAQPLTIAEVMSVLDETAERLLTAAPSAIAAVAP
jgi:hypothetical protein